MPQFLLDMCSHEIFPLYSHQACGLWGLYPQVSSLPSLLDNQDAFYSILKEKVPRQLLISSCSASQAVAYLGALLAS